MTDSPFNQNYTDYQLNRSKFRVFVRKAYLWNIRRHCVGRVIDLGCGVGELLNTLPESSLGLEINQATVEHCVGNGLNVSHYNVDEDQYSFINITPNVYGTIVVSHVLEHLDNPQDVLKRILNSAKRIGVRKFVGVVPGPKGYASDSTHKTFIDKSFVVNKLAPNIPDWNLNHCSYFPFHFKFIGNFFTHNELCFVFESKS